MLPAALLYIAMFSSSFTETPFIAYDLALNMSRAQRIEWSKMRDDENNVRFIITFHKIPLMAEIGFERTFVNKHNNCQTSLQQNRIKN
jgi:hypothetical protein